MHGDMSCRSARLIPTLAFLAACGRSASTPPPLTVYEEPRAAPAVCGAPAVRALGPSPVPDPQGACVKAVQPSALALVPGGSTTEWGVIDLGVRTVGDVATFTVPPGTASLTIVEQVVSAAATIAYLDANGSPSPAFDNAAVVAELSDPSGALVFTDLRDAGPLGGAADGSADPLFLFPFTAVAGALTYPNTTASLLAAAGGMTPGVWSVRVGDWAYECALANGTSPPAGLAGLTCAPDPALLDPAIPAYGAGTYRLYALTRRAAPTGPAIAAAGTLDVTFHIVDSPAPGTIGITAAEAAAGNPEMARLVESYAKLMANAGICLGTVTFRDAPGWARTRFGAGVPDDGLSPCSEFSQLLTLSVPRERTLDLFLVTRIGGTGGTLTTLGIDGSIPGPATVNGTVVSGAMVSAEDLGVYLGPGSCPATGAPLDFRCGTDEVAYVAAHESGHYLGLYHASEATGDAWDPLTSTPRCLCSCDTACSSNPRSPDAAVSVAACAKSTTCGGGENLMFWLFQPSRSRGYLTPEQGQVARASPLVR